MLTGAQNTNSQQIRLPADFACQIAGRFLEYTGSPLISSGEEVSTSLAERFRSYLPVVIDIETGGFNAKTDAVLEIAAVFVSFKDELLVPWKTVHHHVTPKIGTNIEAASLKITGIDLTDPKRKSISEQEAFRDLFTHVRAELKNQNCQRAILVAHNAAFDQQFINSVCERSGITRSPFHPFSTIDTASLSALAVGHTVLSKACARAGVDFDTRYAHSAIYDAQKTAELFCTIVNRWKSLGGWPLEGKWT